MYVRVGKRLFDISLSVILLFILFPLICLLYFLVLVYNGKPAIFVQNRPGKNERIIKIFKFRTMTDAKDTYGDLLPDSKRITRLGENLRKWSLDELPQLLNVLKGDISFVGPRPLLIEYLPLYSSDQRKRHSVKPGITGWAQVNGRNAISWEKKFEYDIWYVQNISFLLDVKILHMTVKKVLKAEDISSNNNITMEKFSGNG